MSWVHLGSLLWLLPLGGAIVALYLLKMRRQNLRVPAIFLWPARTDEVRANSLFQRLRFSWLLVLQLLALALLVIALARPQLLQAGLAGETTVVVLDASGSMGATDVSPSRYAEGKRILLEIMASARPGDRLAAILAGPTPEVLFALTEDPERQRGKVERAEGADAAVDVGEAMRLASALVSEIGGARIVLISDGAFPPIENFSPGKAEVVFKRVGKSDRNLAISAMGVTEDRLLVSVSSHSESPLTGALSIYADGELIDSRRVDVAPNRTESQTLQIDPKTTLLEARLEAEDALAADNYAVTLANPTADLRVLLVGPAAYFLERALLLDPRVTLDRASAVPDSEKPGAPGPSSFDIVIFQGMPEQPVKARSVLAFASAGPGSPVVETGEIESPEHLDTVSHPLTEDVSLESVYIGKMREVTAREDADVLVEAEQGPMVVVRDGLKRQVYVAFRPVDSDFPLDVSFPIFVANALKWLGGEARSDVMTVEAGRSFAVGAGEGVTATLDGPSGEHKIAAHQGRFIVRELDRVGEHTLSSGQGQQRVYAYLRDAEESAIAPIGVARIGGDAGVAETRDLRRFGDYWKIVALVGLAVLALEWWMYARRS